MQRVIAALDARRWTEVAALTDPESLRRFAAKQVDELRRLETVRSVVDVLRERSSLPPETLELYARQEAESRQEHQARFAHIYDGRDTSSELARLPAEALFLMWLAASDPAEQIRLAAAHVERDHPGFTEISLQAEQRFRREILVTEHEEADLALVTYREWFGLGGVLADDGGVFRVARLRRTAVGWRMEVDAELMGHESLMVVVEPADG